MATERGEWMSIGHDATFKTTSVGGRPFSDYPRVTPPGHLPVIFLFFSFVFIFSGAFAFLLMPKHVGPNPPAHKNKTFSVIGQDKQPTCLYTSP